MLSAAVRRAIAASTPPEGIYACLAAEVVHLLVTSPANMDHQAIENWITAIMDPASGVAAPAAESILIRAKYGDSLSTDIDSDIARIARLNAITKDEVITRHLATTYVVAFCGFQPGFAYLEPLPDSPALIAPRHDSPRKFVPRGSIALGGPYCGIYPDDGPGGWNLIGSALLDSMEPQKSSICWIPGTTVRFQRVMT